MKYIKWIGALLGYDIPDDMFEKETPPVEEVDVSQNDVVLPPKIKQPSNNPIGAILFQLTEIGDLNVQVKWDDEHCTEGHAKIFGEFLYHVCVGNFSDTVKQVVCQIAMEDIGHRDFVQTTLKAWENKRVEKTGDDDEPAISPLAVFNMTQTKDESSA